MTDYFSDLDINIVSYEALMSDQSVVSAQIKRDILYLEAGGQEGEISVNVSAADSEGEIAELEIYVAVKNTPPVIEKQIGELLVISGREYTLKLEQYFSDPDGLPVTIDVLMEDNENIVISESTNNILHITDTNFVVNRDNCV